MKNRVFATFSCLALLTSAAAFAQNAPALKADIPFEFHAGGTTLPAGHYEVLPGTTSSVMTIRCYERKAAAVLIVNGVERSKAAETGSLVFNKYHGAYFLSKVWSPGDPRGRELPKSKAEREMARNDSPEPPVVVAALTRR